MRYRLRRFAVHQTALTVAALYFFLAILFVPIFYIFSRFSPTEQALPGMLFIFIPVLYAVFGYIGTAIACWFYNLVAGWAGGVEFTLEASESGAGAPIA